MYDIDLTPALRLKHSNFPRTRGRYYASELYGITHGYVTPRQWIDGKEKTPEDMLKMFGGTLVHDHVQRLLPADQYECEKKLVHYDNGIQLVCKVDVLPKHEDCVWEIKSSFDLMDGSKPSHDYQGRLYCTVFERPITKIFQPISHETGLWLKLIGTVSRDDEWFKEEMLKLHAFHKKVEKLYDAAK